MGVDVLFFVKLLDFVPVCCWLWLLFNLSLVNECGVMHVL